MPLYLFVLLRKMQVSMFRLAVVGPLVMRVWRTRRYLADATAVQLTRNPDALANAWLYQGDHGALVPGGQWFSHLLLVGLEAAKARGEVKSTWSQELAVVASHPSIAPRVNRLVALGARLKSAEPGAPAAHTRWARPRAKRHPVLTSLAGVLLFPLRAAPAGWCSVS